MIDTMGGGRFFREGKAMASLTGGIGTFGADDRFNHIVSPLGGITLAASPLGLRGLWFDGQRHFPAVPERPMAPRDALLCEAERQLREYFAGRRRVFELPLDLSRGTAFQQGVWRQLAGLSFGSTTTYAGLATRIGHARAVRAVGAAVGRNPISIIVPCHRVLGSDGSLTGYAGGPERKIALLRIEGRHDLVG